MFKKIQLLLLSFGFLGLSYLIISSFVSAEGIAEVKTNTVNNENEYNVFSLEVPSKMNFAGEQVPLEDPEIWERFDRELLVNTYWQSNGILLIKRAEKYFPIIEPILEKNGIPDDFKYLALAESGLMPVVSPAGATGFWQIMKSTGKEYGLEINDNVDERYHIEKATAVACEYFKKSKEKFGSWTLAAAAYNAGNTGISRQLERQSVSNYYDLLLVEETSRYVFRILALKEIVGDYDKYGFKVDEDHFYDEVSTRQVKVDTAVSDLADFARKFDISYKVLKRHNPWLRENKLNNSSRKEYWIEIPNENQYKFMSLSKK
ncbi:MAG: lytic transglycosylase domain-containing protein [Bacteroidota bacterium]